MGGDSKGGVGIVHVGGDDKGTFSTSYRQSRIQRTQMCLKPLTSCLLISATCNVNQQYRCQNGAQCVADTLGGFTCICTAGYTGASCETRESSASGPRSLINV